MNRRATWSSSFLLLASAAALRCTEPDPVGDPPEEPCTIGGDPITHSTATLTADETWAPGIHVVPQKISVRDGATLTLSNCSEIRLGKDVSISVESTGKALVAKGTAARPITFVRADSTSAWGNLFAFTPATMSLAYATLEGGGGTVTNLQNAEYQGASLVARGTQDAVPQQVLTVENVTVRGSTGLGVMMLGARFTASSNTLTISGSGFYPLYTGANALSELPTGVYTGNATDEILLQSVGPAGQENSRPIVSDVTIHSRGVPYRVGVASRSIQVGDGFPNSGNPQLTIEAGVTLKFMPQTAAASQLRVSAVNRAGTWQAQGALVVQGTTTQPVRFTSGAMTPAAGDWAGLYFANVVDPRSSISNAIIEYAGGDSQATGFCPASVGAPNNDADCSIIMFLEDNRAPTQFITQTKISNGRGCGIYRGWAGNEVDFRPTNEFSSVTGCTQSGVRTGSSCSACQ